MVLVAAALIVDLGFFGFRINWPYLNYYTLLSNIACMIFFAALLFGRRDAPRVEGAMVFCITVTGIIYATLLAPDDLAEGHFWKFDNLVLHYVSPLMVIADWVVFSARGRVRAADPLCWLFMPLGYFGYILLRSTFAGDIGDTGSAFPYHFIDPAVQGGWGPMLLGVGGLAVGMAVLGYIIFFVDRLLTLR